MTGVAAAERARLAAAFAAAQAGRLAEAEGILRGLIAEQPALIDARADLAALLLSCSRFADAEVAAREALALKPAHPAALNNLAGALLAQRRPRDALLPLRAALDAQPGSANAHYNLGLALNATDDPHGAIAAYRQALALTPNNPQYMLALSSALSDQHLGAESFELAERALALAPSSGLAQYTLARALRAHDDLPRARRLLDQVIAAARPPLLGEALALLAQVQWELGEFEAATEAARRACALDPGSVTARAALARTVKCTAADDPNLRALEAALEDPTLSSSNRARCLDSIGKCREDLGEHAAAFAAHVSAGAERRTRGLRYDHARELAFEAACRELVADGGATLARLASGAPTTELPVLVVGLPRSGTSLVEQIIASHPDARGCGELPDLGNLSQLLNGVDSARGGPGYPLALRSLTPADAAGASTTYLARLRELAGPEALRAVDKQPFNLRHLGFAAALLPRARVVICERHPVDNCISILSQSFGPRHQYRDDLGDLARYYALCRRLVALWRSTLSLRMHAVSYESLVAEPEAGTRALIEFIGLPWDDRCLKPHETGRAVRTASAWQVKQPIYTSSVGRWRRCGDAILPLVDALRAEGVEVEG